MLESYTWQFNCLIKYLTHRLSNETLLQHFKSHQFSPSKRTQQCLFLFYHQLCCILFLPAKSPRFRVVVFLLLKMCDSLGFQDLAAPCMSTSLSHCNNSIPAPYTLINFSPFDMTRDAQAIDV